MSDPIRLQILDALQAAVESIDGTGDWRNTIATVTMEALGFDASEVQATSVKPWVGIIPQRDQVREEPFGNRAPTWPIDLLAHFDVGTKTARGVASACESIRTDLRRAVMCYDASAAAVDSEAVGDLGVAGVIAVHVADSDDSTGAKQSQIDGVASVQMRITVEFEEGVSDT